MRIDYRAKCRGLKGDIEQYVSVKEYATKHFLVPRAVRYQIAKHKLLGYKISGHWYVKKHIL